MDKDKDYSKVKNLEKCEEEEKKRIEVQNLYMALQMYTMRLKIMIKRLGQEKLI